MNAVGDEVEPAQLSRKQRQPPEFAADCRRAESEPALAATIYRYMGVPLDGTHTDDRGRAMLGGAPVSELF